MAWTTEERREYMRNWRKKNPNYFKNYQREHSKSYKTEKNDIYKSDIPLDERCEGFDELWEYIYKQVLSYWDHIPKYKTKYTKYILP